MANKEKENWLVEILTFIFSWFKTGNDRMDKGISMFTTVVMVVCLVLGLLAMLFMMMDTTLPVISDSIGDGLRSLISPIFDLFSDSDTAVNQMPPPVGGEAIAIDIPVN